MKDNGLEALTSDHPERFQCRAEGGAYLNLRGLPLEALREIDEVAIAKLRWIVRGLQFAMADGADSGHVGGSSSKTEQILALLTSGVLAFDPLHPKHPGRDRLAWSAGHTTPLFHGVVALIYECLRRKGVALSDCAMSQDTLPGGFRPMTAFATYGVFTCMMANAVRVTLINSDVNPSAAAFFIMLAAHDGPETGEDGPTHHGLFWMSLYSAAYPGIKVYKPLDANEAVEMLFLAAQRGEPEAFSCTRPGTPVLKHGDGVPPAREAIHGAYVFKPFRENGKLKKVLAISGGQVMHNTLQILPEIEEQFDVKIVAVTSPQLYEELRRTDPAWTASPGPGSRMKSTGMRASIAKG